MGNQSGFFQYYLIGTEAIGIDMWIGIAEERHRGYGTDALRQMVGLILQRHPGVKNVVIDPEPENITAIRCYEKAGFRNTGETIWDDGNECLLFKIDCSGER